MLVVKQKKTLSNHEVSQIIKLIVEENHKSILAQLSENIIKKFLLIGLKSKYVILYLGYLKKKEIIAYALLIKNLDKFFYEFKIIRFEIILDLIKKFKLISFFSLVLSAYNIDILFVKKKIKKIISHSLNLNLLAVKKKYQNKGFGKIFLIKIFKNHKNYKFISLEAVSIRAINFYKKKFNFKEVGKKFRFFNFFRILVKFNNT